MGAMFVETSFLTNNIIRMMNEKYPKNELTKELQTAQADHARAVIYGERNALYFLMEAVKNDKISGTITDRIQETRQTLLLKIHECLTFLFQRAKAETPEPPTETRPADVA